MSDNSPVFGATVDGLELKQALARIKPAVAKRNSLPVLSGVHVQVIDPGEVILTATDLDLTLRTTLATSEATAGECVIPFNLLEKTVASYTVNGAVRTEPVPFIDYDDEFVITVDGSKLTLKTIPIAEWPRLPDFIDEPVQISVDVAAFVSVAPFCSTETSRPILGGVLIDEGGLYAATDSYRLVTVETDETRHTTERVLVPSAVAPLLSKHGEGRVVAEVGRRQEKATCPDIRFTLPDLTITQRCVDGEFPNYRGLIPTTTNVSLAVEAATLHTEVDKIRKHQTTIGAGPAPLRITGAGDRVVLSLTGQDVGSVERDVFGRLSSEIEAIGFNPDYLASILNGAHGHLEGVDALKPWLVRWSDDVGTTTRLLMPVRIA